jgi:hypothetical protein
VTRKIYITVWDDIPEDKALRLAKMALEALPKKHGIVTFTEGSVAHVHETKAKNTSITIWKDSKPV